VHRTIPGMTRIAVSYVTLYLGTGGRTAYEELLIGLLLGLLEDASRLFLGTRRDEELYGTDGVGAFAPFTSNIYGDALGFESAFGDLCLDP
jgi:hypothetical protein